MASKHSYRGLPPLIAILLFTLPTLIESSPTLKFQQKVAVLKEGETTNMVLSKSMECTDPDGDLTKTQVKSVSPSGSCGQCFEVLGNPPAEDLYYRAGVGTLKYPSAKSYLITVSCEDTKEPAATEVIEVVIEPNHPPVFDPDTKYESETVNAKSSPAGTVIHKVAAKDDENNDLTYSMTVNPTTSSADYTINPVTGEISTTKDMRTMCRTDDTILVKVSDGKTTIGPKVINVQIDDANNPPVASNLDAVVQIPEDSTGTAFKMKFIDPNNDKLTYMTSSTNSAGFAQFKVQNTGNVDIAAGLDYENQPLRQTDVTVVATDSYCPSPEHNMKLQVTDVNEPPTITPVDSSIEACEGKCDISPGYKVIDPDKDERHTWSFESNPSQKGYFTIDQMTGNIKCIVDYNVDKGEMPKTQTFKVMVRDKGNLKTTPVATVTVTFLDCNDNAPVMQEATVVRSTTECTSAGTTLGNIKATDDDSAREQNNVLYYEGSGGAVSVGAGGEIIVNTPLPAGSVVTFKAYAWDRGQTPGPLRSINPTVISVKFTVCPTTPPPTIKPPDITAAPATAATTKSATTKKTSSLIKEGDDPNLPWIIIAALLGTFFLALLSYMLWRYGSLCLRACRHLNCDKSCGKACRGRKPKVREVRVEEIRRQPLQKEPTRRPIQDPKPEPEPEEEKSPPGPGFIYGFWKETYENDDYKAKPSPNNKPKPGDMDYHYPHTYDPVDEPVQPPGAAATTDSPQKNCIVM